MNKRVICIEKKLVSKLKYISSCMGGNHFDSQQARAFLLGSNEDNVVIDAVRLYSYSTKGCFNMPRISETEVSKKMCVLVGKGLNPCGIARVNDCMTMGSGGCYQEERGRALLDMGRFCPNSFMLSIDSIGGLVAETFDFKNKVVVLHSIVEI